MKIQYQLWLTFSIVFITISLAVYIFVSNTYEQSLQSGYEQISITQGYSILDQLRDTYPHSPNRSMGYLEAFSERLDMRLIILNSDKKVYGDSFRQLERNATLNLDILNQTSTPNSLFTKTENYGYIQYTLIPFEIVESQGFLLMVQESEQLYQELESFQNWMLQILLAAVLGFFFISYIVSSWFSKPIRQIIYHLRNITPVKRSFSLEYHRRDEIKELIDTTKNMVEELNLYDERQRQFLSTSAHELKTPLATMHLILENLPYVRENENKHVEFLQDLSFQVKKMRQMVDQLLQINRIWDKKLEKKIMNSQEIKEYILQSFHHIAHNKQMKLEFEMDPVSLYVDRALFLRGLENLVSNAIRYSPPGQTVKVSISNTGKQNKISVCDQGIGISPENLTHIFEPFYRSNEATVWNQEGSGLGLTIVKQMIDMHKGRIEIETMKDKGTCIHLFIPQNK